jgi:hypothetical protein
MTPAGEHRRPLRRIPSGMPVPRNAGGCRIQAHNDQTITSSLLKRYGTLDEQAAGRTCSSPPTRPPTSPAATWADGPRGPERVPRNAVGGAAAVSTRVPRNAAVGIEPGGAAGNVGL